MSKIVAGAAKAVKGVFSGIKKAFSAVWESKIGRVIVIAAAIYFGQ